jgi:hypothetical protein
LRAVVLGFRDLVSGHGASGYRNVRRQQRLDHMPRPVPTEFGGVIASKPASGCFSKETPVQAGW